jgi:serralysin
MATITGTVKNDTNVGTADNDTLDGSVGDDIVSGLGGDDVVNGSSGNDFVYGGDGNDQAVGGTGDDHVYGEAGDDQLVGLTGIDVMDGGTGNDTLLGDPGNDQLWGGPGSDEVRGGRDNDWLNGGSGVDLLAGSPGSDVFSFTFAADMGLDTIEDFTWGDGDRLEVDFDPTQVTHHDTAAGLVLTHAGVDFALLPNFTGASFTLDWFVPLPAPIRNSVVNPNIVGGTGFNDVLTGTAGNDLLNPGGGDDTVSGLGGDDWIDGGRGNDTLSGDAGNDILYGGVGVGNDTLNGGTGDDLIFAGNGFNHVDGGDGNDLVFGAPGRDMVRGGSGNDEVLGEDGADVFSGMNGNDLLFGGAGADALTGGPDQDTLVGGAGVDSLAGQTGADLFVLLQGSADKVQDFNFAQGDRLSLEGVTDLPAFLAGVSASDSAQGLVLSHGSDPFAVLSGHVAAEFDAAWFQQAPVFGPPAYPTDAPPDNRAPVLNQTAPAPGAGQIVPATSLVAWTDADGDVPIRYQVQDLSTDKASGRFISSSNGVDTYIRAGGAVDFTPEGFATLRVDGGLTDAPDLLMVRAYDGALWSDWLQLQ